MKHETRIELLHRSWARCWSGVGAAHPNDALRDELISAYEQAHRSYHTLQHLCECLSLLDAHRDAAQRPDEVELALWFHDAVYNVRAGDNELKSAEWAAEALQSAHVAPATIARLQNHILATRHAVLPEAGDQTLLVDIDLAILGAAVDRFDEYEDQVRREYRWVPDFLFRSKRREILEEFLLRQPLYGTPQLRDCLEASAHANLRRAIDRLS